MTSRVFTSIVLGLTLAAAAITGRQFAAVHEKQTIVRGPGVTRVVPLSTYFTGLAGTPGDTDVFVLESGTPGGTLLVMGGVHANEPAGMLAAVLVAENAGVASGRVFVIPQANASAATHVESSEGLPSTFHIATPSGRARWFRNGGRLTNPAHQYPDPEVYTHFPSGQLQSDFDVRNLDRAFPGRPDGGLTEQIAFGITELVRREQVDLTVDLHEARPMNPIVNCVIFHERAQELATLGAIELESTGVKLRLEPSPKNLRGMSHRELGDHTSTTPVLFETANPIMDRLHGRATERLLLDGKDGFFRRAARNGLLYVPYGDDGLPMEERTGRHLSALVAFARIFGELHPGREIGLEGLPDHAAILARGVGAFLRDPAN
ncbi:MAG: succinylglutamate desuccinylase/aspartoacylase family protein [Rhodospirillaceae bacterium]